MSVLYVCMCFAPGSRNRFVEKKSLTSALSTVLPWNRPVKLLLSSVHWSAVKMWKICGSKSALSSSAKIQFCFVFSSSMLQVCRVLSQWVFVFCSKVCSLFSLWVCETRRSPQDNCGSAVTTSTFMLLGWIYKHCALVCLLCCAGISPTH